MRDYYKPGEWLAICDRCGFKFKASELKLDWQGFRVCEDDFEYRHPQDFLKPKTDKIYVPWSRPDISVEVTASSGTGGMALGMSVLGSRALG